MENKMPAFIELIDNAQLIAKQRLLDESDPAMQERVTNVIRVLQRTRDEALSGNLSDGQLR